MRRCPQTNEETINNISPALPAEDQPEDVQPLYAEAVEFSCPSDSEVFLPGPASASSASSSSASSQLPVETSESSISHLKHGRKSDPQMEELLAVFRMSAEAMQQANAAIQKNKSHIKPFCEFVESMLAKMSSKNQRTAMKKIQDILFEIDAVNDEENQ
ncbi:uncharacterized protein LOC111635120 [Centruroides sculpturatus]|uniref:uncharacterized protein LOC111635120 n=1 Tax=Centruroides sculpturatus TaxID=218467 RepID=UPI000C6C9515|nr:uncharacterized protein LOC111618729 isoform X2 [Centruroides sculpturatus]XP_023235746.1 uncharacterized protein LOC111635120 [Centruroides sculpturatus]